MPFDDSAPDPSNYNSGYDPQQSLRNPVQVPPLPQGDPGETYAPSTMQGSTGDVPLPPRFIDQSGNVRVATPAPYTIDRPDINLAQMAQQAALQPSLKPVAQTIAEKIQQNGSYPDPASYMADATVETYKLAHSMGLDASTPEGADFINKTLNDAKSAAGQYVSPPQKGRYMELKNGALFDTYTGKQINTASSFHQMIMDQQGHQVDMNSQASDAGLQQPFQMPTTITPPSMALGNNTGTQAGGMVNNPMGSVQSQSPQAQPSQAQPPQSKGVDPTFTALDNMSAIDRQTALTGNPIVAKEYSDYVKQKQDNEATPDLNPNAIDALAKRFIASGEIPSIGMGKEAAKSKSLIFNRVSQIMNSSGSSPEQILAKEAAFKATTGELKRLQSQRGTAMTYADTTDKALDYAKSLSDKVDRSGNQFFNKWIMAGKQATGDPDVAAFNAALNTASQEYIKSNSIGSGGNSDAARSHVNSLISGIQTKDQFNKVIDTLHNETSIRRNAYDDHVNSLVNSLSGSASTKGLSDRIDVVNTKTGAVGHIPKSQLQDALNSGYALR